MTAKLLPPFDTVGSVPFQLDCGEVRGPRCEWRAGRSRALQQQ